MKRSGRPIGCALLLLVASWPLCAGSVAAAEPPASALVPLWERWTSEVADLVTEPERDLFAELTSDRQRERFVEAFWAGRGDALERWRRNQADAAQLRPRSPAARRLLLLFGKPEQIEVYRGCESGIRPLEAWRWSSWHLQRQGGPAEELTLVLVQEKRFDPRSLQPWEPGDLGALGFSLASTVDTQAFLRDGSLARCLEDGRENELRERLTEASTLERLSRLAPWPSVDAERVEVVRREIAEAGESPLSASRLDLRYEGSAGRYTIVRGRVDVAVDRLRSIGGGQLFDRVLITGDVFRGDRLADTFVVTHHVVGAVPGQRVDLDFYRRLSPGAYRLTLRVTDRYGRALLREGRDLEVPRLDEAAPSPPGRASGFNRLTRSEVVVLDTFPSVEVLPLPVSGSGEMRATAITTGGPIAAVEFRLDGETVGVDREVPYTVDVRLTSPAATLEAVALDPEGAPLARHETRLTRERRPFAVRFGDAVESTGELPVVLSVPDGQELMGVRCFHGRAETRSLAAPPWRCPAPGRVRGSLDFLRVAATLATGETVEHVLFLGPDAPDGIEVRLLDLYVSVADASGRPVPDLTAGEFRLLDGGEERPLERVEAVDNLPLNVALLMDVSSSMGRRTRLAAASAERFFQRLLTDDDLASLLAFNHDLHLLVPFTADAEELRHGAIGVRARGSTRLHDSIVYALSQFAGLENRRALIVLSDGADVDSDFPFDHVVSAAVEAGVAVYPISILGIENDEETPLRLRRLASESGGRAYTVRSIDDLDRIYRLIEDDLRSQYLLVYRPAPRTDLEFRPVRVEIERPGTEARNVHGYYP